MIRILLSLLLLRAASPFSLTLLDETISRRGEYRNEKQERILYLEKLAESEKDTLLLLRVHRDICSEYTLFRYDKAIDWANRGLALAQVAGNAAYVTLFQLYRAEFFSVGGLYSESEQCLSMLDTSSMDKENLFQFYRVAFRLYSYKASFVQDREYHPVYESLAAGYLEKAVEVLSPDDPLYAYYWAEKCYYLDRDPVRARDGYLSFVSNADPSAREYAMACYALAGYYLNTEHDQAKYMDYLVRSAVADISSASMEYTALQRIALALYDGPEKDLRRADRYIRLSLEDARFYNNRLRLIEISQVLPQIVDSYQAALEQKNRMVTGTLLVISVLLLGLLYTVRLIHRRNRTLFVSRQDLARKNEALNEANGRLSSLNAQLSSLNSTLVEVNRKREALASIYIDMCAKYIAKFSEYRTLVMRKVKVRQADDLLTDLTSTRLSEREQMTFLSRFDKAFLNMYPSFLDDFNCLLRSEERIQLRSDHSLTTELRVYALVRLGVTNTSDIAGLLFLSPQTIYNCRSVTRSKALNKETFEADVRMLSM